MSANRIYLPHFPQVQVHLDFLSTLCPLKEEAEGLKFEQQEKGSSSYKQIASLFKATYILLIL